MTTETIHIRAATGRGYDFDRHRESLVDVVHSPRATPAEKARAERLIQEGDKAARYVSDAYETDARTWVPKQDPIARFSARHRHIALELRMHHAGLVVFEGMGKGPSEFVEGRTGQDMETLCDRRKRGQRAWDRALDAITPRKPTAREGVVLDRAKDYRDAVRKVILGEVKLGSAAELIGLKANSHGYREIVRVTEDALDAAADYLGVRG